MPQFFIDKKFTLNDELQIRGSDAKHILQSLRLKSNDWIVLSDGHGRSFRATITATTPTSLKVRILEEIVRNTGSSSPTLALAVIKGERFEWAIQKTVELGCRHIIPFISERCQPQNTYKVDRWLKIALEAAKQSGLQFKPTIERPVKFEELFSNEYISNRAILFYEGEKDSTLSKTSKLPDDVLIIGPEGGFAPEEIKLAEGANAVSVSLGPQILRVETAAISAMTIWQYEIGNMDIQKC